VRWGPFKSRAAERARSELEVSVPLAFQRSGPTRLPASSAAPQAVGRLHVPRQQGFVRPPDDFRRNPIGRKSRCAHHRLGIAKPRQLTARPHLSLRSFFRNSAGAGQWASAPWRSVSHAAAVSACRDGSTPSRRRSRPGPSNAERVGCRSSVSRSARGAKCSLEFTVHSAIWRLSPISCRTNAAFTWSGPHRLRHPVAEVDQDNVLDHSWRPLRLGSPLIGAGSRLTHAAVSARHIGSSSCNQILYLPRPFTVMPLAPGLT
jgi:hypothetical protein